MLSMADEIVSPDAIAQPARAIKGRRLRRILSESLIQRVIDWSIETARSAKKKQFMSQEAPALIILPYRDFTCQFFAVPLSSVGRLRWWPRVIPTSVPAPILKEELNAVWSTANVDESTSPWGNLQENHGPFV
jgi:hypothetical protein